MDPIVYDFARKPEIPLPAPAQSTHTIAIAGKAAMKGIVSAAGWRSSGVAARPLAVRNAGAAAIALPRLSIPSLLSFEMPELEGLRPPGGLSAVDTLVRIRQGGSHGFEWRCAAVTSATEEPAHSLSHCANGGDPAVAAICCRGTAAARHSRSSLARICDAFGSVDSGSARTARAQSDDEFGG